MYIYLLTCGGSKLGRHQLPMQSSITQSCFTPSCRPRICHPVKNYYYMKTTTITALNSVIMQLLPQSSGVSIPPPHLHQDLTLHPACRQEPGFQTFTAFDSRLHGAVILTVWRKWSPAAEVTHEVACARGQLELPPPSSAFPFYQTLHASAETGPPLSCLSRTEAPWCQMCSWWVDI